MTRRLPAFEPSDSSIGLLGACALLPFELIALGLALPEPSTTVMALFVLIGISIGLVIATQEAVLRVLGHDPTWTPWIRASGSLVVWIPLSHHLFEGAFAATLPGADHAPSWMPVLGLAATAAAIAGARRILATGVSRIGFGAALIGLAGLLEIVNRTVKRSELQELHVAVLLASCVIAGVGMKVVLDARGAWPPPGFRRARTAGIVVASAAVLACTAVGTGLSDPESRWTLARSGIHGRLLVQIVRDSWDHDGDGHAPILGGADCDDDDPERHPMAHDLPDDGIDQNCDGTDAVPAPSRPDQDSAPDAGAWRTVEANRRWLEAVGRMNVLLVVVDALRADAVRIDDASAAIPNTLALFAESMLFSRAFAPAAGTDLSLSSLMTGRIDPFSDVETTLAEAMQASGRATYAVIPTEVLRYVGRVLLLRGMDDHRVLLNDRFEQDVGSYTTSTRTTTLGIEFLDRHLRDRAGKPFFLWLHYFDVHEHHEVEPSDRHLRDFLDGSTRPSAADRYRALVRLVDAEIGRLAAALRERSLTDDTLVVFVSDHGESLREDPRLPENHGKYLYNPLIHVPLAIRVPGGSTGVDGSPVSLIDVAPTLLEATTARTPTSDGRSLLSRVAPARDTHDAPVRALPLNESDQFGVIRWPHKLMIRPLDNLTELYDLEKDFAEAEDLSLSEPARVQELLAIYRSFPVVQLDRSRRGRRLREQNARQSPDL